MTKEEANQFFQALSQVKVEQTLPGECKKLFQFYKYFIEAGFNEEQSFKLLLFILSQKEG